MKKSAKKKTQQEPDSSALFPVKVEGYEIKPWSFGQTIDLMPVWESVATRLQDKGIALKSITKNIPALIAAILPDTPHVLSITLGVPEDEIRAWDLKKASVVLLNVINLNLEHLKNLPGLVTQAVDMIKS